MVSNLHQLEPEGWVGSAGADALGVGDPDGNPILLDQHVGGGEAAAEGPVERGTVYSRLTGAPRAADTEMAAVGSRHRPASFGNHS